MFISLQGMRCGAESFANLRIEFVGDRLGEMVCGALPGLQHMRTYSCDILIRGVGAPLCKEEYVCLYMHPP
jgi:hypothetical protein